MSHVKERVSIVSMCPKFVYVCVCVLGAGPAQITGRSPWSWSKFVRGRKQYGKLMSTSRLERCVFDWRGNHSILLTSGCVHYCSSNLCMCPPTEHLFVFLSGWEEKSFRKRFWVSKAGIFWGPVSSEQEITGSVENRRDFEKTGLERALHLSIITLLFRIPANNKVPFSLYPVRKTRGSQHARNGHFSPFCFLLQKKKSKTNVISSHHLHHAQFQFSRCHGTTVAGVPHLGPDLSFTGSWG